MPADTRRLGRWTLNAVATLAMAYILTPLVAVTWLAFWSQEIPTFPPEGYTLSWFTVALRQDRFVNGFLTSLQVGVAAMVVGLLVGVPAALAIARRGFPGRAAVNQLLLMPLIVPGVVLGTSIYVFHVESEIATGLPILGSIPGLIGGHTLIVIPWVVRLIIASLAGFDRAIEEAALNLGATPWTAFFRITLPSIRPGIVAGALFGFVTSFGNLEMSLFLLSPGMTTLPIAILQYLEWRLDPTIAAVSVMQITLIAVAMIVTDRYVKLARVV
ncbi:MAG: ABC transporter permease [Gemmatimonadales bacterium]|nr:ABC transporter permease [Gemmatimonadales bacterium]